MARRHISNERAREIDAEAWRTGVPALRAPTEDEEVAMLRQERGKTDTIRPTRGASPRTETDQKLGYAATVALAGAAGATSLPAALVSLVPDASRLRRDLKERGAEGLLDPANLMLFASIKSGTPLPEMLKNPRMHGVMYHGTKNKAALSWDQVLPPKQTGAQTTDARSVNLNMDKIFGTRSLKEAASYAGKDGMVLLVSPKNPQRHKVRHRNSSELGEIYKADSGDVIGGLPVKRLEDPVSEDLAYQLKLHEMSMHQDAKGGEADVSDEALDGAAPDKGLPGPSATPVPQSGPRIVINPQVFNDRRDALCVAMNEAFRILMEVSGFDPVSEPTKEQREFFVDTAYANNEEQLRRTIVARICTFDTSVRNPTDEQLQESVEFLESVMEMGAPQNEWEQRAVQRLHDVLAEASAVRREEPVPGDTVAEEPVSEEVVAEEPVQEESAEEPEEVHGDVLGGVTKDEENELQRLAKLGEENAKETEEINRFTEERGMDTSNGAPTSMEEAVAMHEKEMQGEVGNPDVTKAEESAVAGTPAPQQTGDQAKAAEATPQQTGDQAKAAEATPQQTGDQAKAAEQWKDPSFGKGAHSGLVIGGRERTAAEAEQLYKKIQSGGSVTKAERNAVSAFVDGQRKAAGFGAPQEVQPQQAQQEGDQPQEDRRGRLVNVKAKPPIEVYGYDDPGEKYDKVSQLPKVKQEAVAQPPQQPQQNAQPQQAQQNAQPQQPQQNAQPQEVKYRTKIRRGIHSGVRKDNRQLTSSEAKWIYRRQVSGASVSKRDLEALRNYGAIA